MSEQIKESSATEVGDVGLPEDLARADLYGLIARLFHEAPDQELLDQIVSSIPEGQEAQSEAAPLARVWQNLVEMAKANPAKAWQDEFDQNFISVGRPIIILNGSFYMAGYLNERPLVEIRRALDAFGLESAEEISETEDHISALCEVMRYLIAGDDVEISNLTNQRVFFNDHIRPWHDDLFDAIDAVSEMRLYHSVASLAREFLAIEGQGFDMI
ncbi:TorD/DmsD family molecular chaperone [Polynucleobacter bastaniensis]|jgi:TorA maturation chaperone TorD|uniref:TorD/DmsD family molecular chaperone n=1 Tax=Polynucleobacter bastaniensis TaxID=2081039 RepID=UPI001C0C73B9|nr:molecular chaperone TorD family protein [Polynucleobacter bastaniensis]MBU3597774.1 molecular chaperone TorD family protein [Polynucleobacter bastaniensis]